MAGSVVFQSFCCVTETKQSSTKCFNNQPLAFSSSRFFCSDSLLRLKKQSLHSALPIKRRRTPKHRSVPSVFAAQSNFLKVVQTAWKIGRDGIEAGTNLVPDSVPRPIARLSVTGVALTLSLFVLKSFISTAFFVLATIGLVYFIFIALNKDEGPKGGGGTSSTTKGEGMEDSLEEARRIMEKYK